MVKVESLSREEVALREKKSKLVEITRGVLGINTSQQIYLGIGTIGIGHYSSEAPGHPIFIDPRINCVHVESKSYFEEAMKLATAYEQAFPGEEFTVKKEYE